MIENLQKLLRTLFWPKRRASERSDFFQQGGLLGRRELVLPRARLLYRQFDLSEIPAGRRRQVLQLKLDAWRPLAQARYWFGWQGGLAHVWAWSAEEPLCAAQKGEAVVPESVLQEMPGQEGPRLLESLTGFEGQAWRDGQLIQSRWWSSQPDQSQWDMFLRSAGFGASPVPLAQAPEWLMRPWLKSTGSGLSWLEQNEKPLVVSVAILFTVLLGWQMAQAWRAERVLSDWQDRLAALEAGASQELAARDQAFAELARAESMLGLVHAVEPLMVLDQVTDALPSMTRLTEWQHDAHQIRFLISADTPPDPEQAVRAFSALEGFRDVMAERGRQPNTLEIHARIERLPLAP